MFKNTITFLCILVGCNHVVPLVPESVCRPMPFGSGNELVLVAGVHL
jgi:hypothetical protein